MRIIIIEDEFLIQKALRSTLERAGHHVVGHAPDVLRGLRLVAEAHFDAAIVDANLNGASAEPVLAALHGMNIPALMISGYSAIQQPHWTQTRLLTKPFAPEDLLQAINELPSAFYDHPACSPSS